MNDFSILQMMFESGKKMPKFNTSNRHGYNLDHQKSILVFLVTFFNLTKKRMGNIIRVEDSSTKSSNLRIRGRKSF